MIQADRCCVSFGGWPFWGGVQESGLLFLYVLFILSFFVFFGGAILRQTGTHIYNIYTCTYIQYVYDCMYVYVHTCFFIYANASKQLEPNT